MLDLQEVQHRWDVIGVSASSSSSEERKVDSAVKSACVLLTSVVIVNCSPSSETAGSKLALPEPACKPGCAEAVFGFDLVCWSFLDRTCFETHVLGSTPAAANCDWEFPITKFGTWKGESDFS